MSSQKLDQAVMRSGGSLAGSLTVQVKTWEPNQEDAGANVTDQSHDITFAPGANVATLNVVARQYQQHDATTALHTLNAQITASSDDSYLLGNPRTDALQIVDVNGAPYPQPQIALLSADTPLAVTEGGNAVLTLTRYGDSTQPLTVDILVDDPDRHLQVNHWDPPTELPSQVTFGANQTSRSLTIPVPDDQRDESDGSFTVYVLPSFDYILSHTVNGMGRELFRQVDVTDNDAAQELELNFGKDGVNDADVDEGDTLGFVVKRRQQDADNGTTATFTVRLETDRGGDDHVLSDWTEDTSSGRLYKDYHLQLTGSDLEVEEEFTVTENGEAENSWSYWASIRPIEDHQGIALDSTEGAQYWTVKSGFRETTVDATDSGASNGTVRLNADRATVTEGEEVVLTVTREDGPISQPLTVTVRTREPNRNNQSPNPSRQDHQVVFQPWDSVVSFSVYPYVDGVAETGTDELKALFRPITTSRYSLGIPDEATIEINDPPSGSAFVSLSGTPASMAEGDSATFTFTRSGGDTTQSLTVDIRVDDPEDLLRGNHWDSPTSIPTQVEFDANSTSTTLTLTAPDDQRDLTDGDVKVWVLPGTGYLLGNTGVETSATVSVTDNDEAQELTFDWGFLDSGKPEIAQWEDGESFCYQNEDGEYVSGPAEALFYYEDDRHFRIAQDADEYFPIHFNVIRRAEDVGKTATFVVGVEHDRGWDFPRHADWLTAPETGRRYKDYEITLTGDQRQVVGRIEILDNGIPDLPGWRYWASIRQIEDANGVALSSDEETQYWTVSDIRSLGLRPFDRLFPEVYLRRDGPAEVEEGQQVEFTVERVQGNALAPLPVRVLPGNPTTRQTTERIPPNRSILSRYRQ